MCYITKWHCGSKMCYQWGNCVTNVLPLGNFYVATTSLKVVYYIDYKRLMLLFVTNFLTPYCVTADPMRITKWKGFCYEILSFLYTLLLYSIRIYNCVYCLFSTISLKKLRQDSNKCYCLSDKNWHYTIRIITVRIYFSAISILFFHI